MWLDRSERGRCWAVGGGSGQRGSQGPAWSEALSTGLCAEMGSLGDSAGREDIIWLTVRWQC